ncbi:MAG TPA: MAPEG family protein [Myxococcota bacterium]|nr:MAPEG family protein [Myxococcota bacterium]
MTYVAIVVALALVEYLLFALAVGRARGQYGVKAPATTGHEIFERHYRVHENTLEQLVVFLPAIYLFGAYVSGPIAALLGLAFVVGRAVYARSYVADPEKRTAGFLIGYLANAVMLLGGLFGALWKALAG